MGFYDNRCMATGVSLCGSDAALVLLQQSEADYHPIALALKGNYDRLGAIDGIAKDANTRLLLTYFRGKVKTGEFDIDKEHFRIVDAYPIKTLEHVLIAFERNMNDGQENWLNGQPIVFALICRAVWDALVRSAAPVRKSATMLFQELFGGSSVAKEIYKGSLTKVIQHLRELSAVSNFLARRKLAWQPTIADGAQHSNEEMRQYLHEARQAFKGSTPILEGLTAYELEVAECLEELDTN